MGIILKVKLVFFSILFLIIFRESGGNFVLDNSKIRLIELDEVEFLKLTFLEGKI
jgi:hypothetical protein